MKHDKEQDSSSSAALDAARAELFALLLGAAGGHDATGIPRRYPPAASAPLSFGQEALWFLSELGAASGAYNLPLAFRIAGPLDVQALQVSFAELIARHETLRTRFDLEKGRPMQIVERAESFTLDVVEAPLGDPALQELMRQEAHRPFHLAHEYAFRAVLYRRAANESALLITLHHIICDTQSIAVLLRDLAALYAAAVSGDSVNLPPLDIQYADYALWQRGIANGGMLEEQLAYWKRRLANHSPLDLPVDSPRPALPTFAGRQLLSTLPPQVVAALRDLAQREGATLFMLLVSLVQLLLSRWSGHRDIVIGTPIAGRPDPATENLIGYFANTVLIRAGLDGVATFRELLRHVKQSALEAYSNQDVPFERIVSALHVQRDLSRQPLFQVMVVLQEAGPRPLQLPGIDVTELTLDRGGSKFDLSLEFFERDGELAVRCEYATDLFLHATMERLSRQFQALAGEVALDPDRALDAVTLLSAAEQRQLRGWNDTAVPIDTDRSVHELFEDRVRLTPAAVAVKLGELAISYAQLNERSNQFAHYLIASGVGPDTVVGLFFERSIELVVGMLGVLKAGGAYLPIDTSFPDARVAYLFADARPKLVATCSDFSERLSTICGSESVCLIDPRQFIDRPITDPAPRARGRHLAYVMYTSGSTGKPKGVETSRTALLNRLLWMQAEYAIGERDRILQKTPYTFDVSVWEFIWPLMNGAQLVLATPGGHRDVHYLRETIRDQAITVAHFVPSMLAAFLAQSSELECPSLRHVVCSGEALTPALVQRFFAAHPSARLHNLYGPTEAAIDVTCFECSRHVEHSSIPIGRPIWNTQMHVLDDDLEPVAIGVVGELYIGGVGLARGYRHRPDLTAERFIANPFSQELGARLYRTGDLAKYRADGALEYLGRGDQQVKIRGVRIELGEVEAALLAAPRVRDCAVVVREHAGGKQLVACLSVAGDPRWFDRRELRALLLKTLPDYLVPDVFEVWPQLPVTSNGKLDRKALTAAQHGAVGPATVSAEARSDVEARLLRIWRDVLDTPSVDPLAGFFDIGGNSILAVTVARRVAEEFQQPFYVTDLFKHASVRNLSGALAAACSSGDGRGSSHYAASDEATESVQRPSEQASYPNCVAVIGMSCNFPGAADSAALWNNLKEGRESIEMLSAQQLHDAEAPADLLSDPRYVAARSTITGKASFDAAFFKITARDAQLMDPQLRHLLEHSWRAVEDGGYRASQIPDTAVFMSASSTFYHAPAFANARAVLERSDEYVAWIWAQPGTIPTLVSHKLGLKGPSLFVHANCSSSLVGLASAYRSITSGEARHALVGAATILPYASLGYLHQDGMHFSSDGHLKAFDADADGMISGEGVAVLLLKNAADAIADGDHIHALLRGIALNNDGADKAGFYAPSAKGQADVIDKVLQATGVDPDSIGYVEAHGTGTRLGDPIEFGALSEVYRRHTSRRQFCGLGSIKSNFGHLDTAAGLAGCLKVVLSLAHAQIPPTLHFKAPNPQIDLENSPFHIVRQLAEWPRGASPRRAALSSFGIGGTNVHAIFEEWVRPAERAERGDAHGRLCLIPLSARSVERLKVYADLLASFLAQASTDETCDAAALSLENVAFTLQVGREEMDHRIAFIAGTLVETVEKLRRYVAGDTAIDGFFRGEIKRHDQGDALFSADEDLQRTVDSWIEKEKYKKLLELWVRGFAFDWHRLHRNSRSQRVSLPTYPFARQDYWLAPESRQPSHQAGLQSAVAPASAPLDHGTAPGSLTGAVAARSAPVELMTLQEQWTEKALVGKFSPDPKRVLCLAADEALALQAASELREHNAHVEVILLWPAAASESQAPDRHTVVRDDGESYRQVLANVANHYGEVDAVVYAGAMNESANENEWRGVVHLVQGLFASGLKCGRLLLCAAYEDALSRCHAESWIGIERSLRVLVPQLPIAVMVQQGALQSSASVRQWAQRMWAELSADEFRSVCYAQERRCQLQVQEQMLTAQPGMLRTGGVYWIAGGAGGLGALVARYLIERYAAKVVLSGRRTLDETRQAQLREWTQRGGEVMYVAADVTDEAAMHACVAQVIERFGAINGVIHSAGVLDVGTVIDKSLDAFEQVLSPKVRGTLVLDDVLNGQELQFICYFSSNSAVLGDFGSCDYAMGNRFEMAYAQYAESKGACKRIAINWPVWAEGGMQVGEQADTKLYLQSSGQQALTAAMGLDLFERTLTQPSGHYLVMYGQRARIERYLGLSVSAAEDVTRLSQSADAGDLLATAGARAGAVRRRPELRGLTLEQCVQWELKEQISELLKLSREQIQAQDNLADHGFDSITLAQWAKQISRHYAIALTPAIFFSHSTLEKVGSYLLSKHAEHLQTFYRESAQAATVLAPSAAVLRRAPAAVPHAQRTESNASAAATRMETSTPEPVAIIGVSGRFPQARTVEAMWRILAEGRDAVGEIPLERFDWREPHANGTIRSKWLGTMPGVAEFDPLFFDLSPREALGMDPRQRLLLQEAWNALEDAAYGDRQYAQQKVGMFVGVEQGEYQLLAGGQGTLTSNHDAILASRLSYFLNLRGPAMAINTSCSSGLVAAHQACLSLRAGECDAAIAAGVNLMLTPHAYWGMSQAGMLSEEGRCYAFDKRANGMVPGEAVVALVLKRLSRAQADGDPIQAVIVGSGINYDGRTNGITAPSGAAQAQLIREVYERAGIDPRHIGYIVTHGTGTRLGDPVEINALDEVFRAHTAERGFCALTSAKSNFGHAFAASGLLNVVCAVQALKHRTIPASLHCEQQSDYIDWERSAFYVNRQTQPWPSNGLRYAALSAFGMSGTNAHMVLQEYEAPAEAGEAGVTPYWILALSAKSASSLQQRLHDLREALQAREWDAPSVQSLSYTLLCGRQHFAHRCMIVAQDREDAIHLLERAAAGDRPAKVFSGVAPREFSGQKALLQYGRDLLDQLSSGSNAGEMQESLYALADLYCQGYALPWQTLFGETAPRRIALPTYPFSREQHWVDTPTRSVEVETPGGIALVATQAVVERAPRAARPTSKPTGITLQSLTLTPRGTPPAVAAVAVAAPVAVKREPIEPVVVRPAANRIDASIDAGKLQAELSRTLAEALYMEVSDVEPHKPFAEMGLDSIIGVEWVRVINRRHELQMPAARIYDYPNVHQLSQYLAQLLQQRAGEEASTREPAPGAAASNAPSPMETSEKTPATAEGQPSAQLEPSGTPREVVAKRAPSLIRRQAAAKVRHDDIAIIGMSGRYPEAPDLETFWRHLSAGRDAVREIPSWRWDANRYYDPRPHQAGRINCKWLGALQDVECFDPLFFSISPAEAQLMDPQQRLFVQESYRAFEDAGYNPRALGNSRCGVYLGIMSNDYSTLLHDSGHPSDSTGNSAAIAAARISYILDLKGPAISIDTACSSSLVATHLACQALRNEEIELALVGGVTLYLTPGPYFGMCAAGMLSSDGRCKALDNSANGFVPGEGVGALVLKRLCDAQAAGDPIHGVIIGSGINQDGKTNGITAPSANRQSELQREVYGRYGIDPKTIGYVEMHGTGTKLGDPIELEALLSVYGAAGVAKNSCALGSVKSNIGHTSAAAGVAGVHKVLLSLRHRQLVPTLHFKEPNEHFDFANSPFYVSTELREWQQVSGACRRAAVSSFGYSGTNAHVVIEEYAPGSATLAASTQSPGLGSLIILSARTAELLQQRVADLLVVIEAGRLDRCALADLAYTLQVGREPLPHRLALEANSLEQLREKLRRYSPGVRNSDDFHQGEARSGKDTLAVFAADEELHELIGKWLSRGKHHKLLDLWVKGLAVEWQRLYGETPPRRLSLPTYPFAKERYWIALPAARSPASTAPSLHPLVQQNTSDLDEQRFSSEFDGREPGFAECSGAREMQAMAHLEMARAALQLAAGWKVEDAAGLSLQQVCWLQPIEVEREPIRIHIALSGPSAGPVEYEIFSERESGDRLVHSCGTALRTTRARPQVDIGELQAQAAGGALASVVVPWTLPGEALDTSAGCLLQPQMPEPLLQAMQSLLGVPQEQRLVPQSLDALDLFGDLGSGGYAVIRKASPAVAASVDVQLCDEHGSVRAELRGLALGPLPQRMPRTPASIAKSSPSAELMILQEQWQEQSLECPLRGGGRVVCFVADSKMAEQVGQSLREIAPDARPIWVLPGNKAERADADRYFVVGEDGADHRHLLAMLAEEHGRLDAVVFGTTLRASTDENDWRRVFGLLQGLFASGLKCGRLLLCTAHEDVLSCCHAESWIGIERSLRVLVPQLPVAVMVQQGALQSAASVRQWTQRVWTQLSADDFRSVRYEQERRYRLQVQERMLVAQTSMLRTGGVYWITGGAGGLGALVTQYLIERYAAKVVLSGRRELDEARQAQLREWARSGGEVMYVAVDVSDETAMRTCVAQVNERFGPIDGVIHAAGVLDAASVTDKSQDAFERVLSPKVRGTLVLEEVLQGQPLQFICYFSSSSAVLGDFGSCDYAMGNRFQMAYAQYTESAGDCKRIAINWPMWADGGIQAGEQANTQLYLQSSGQQALPASVGLELFERALNQTSGHYLVMYGQRARVERYLGLHAPSAGYAAQPLRSAEADTSMAERAGAVRRRPELRGLTLERCVQLELKEQISELLKLDREQIQAQANLADYGFDSLTLAQWAKRISQHYAIELTPAIFFSHPTLEKVAGYLLSKHAVRLQAFYREPAEAATTSALPAAVPRRAPVAIRHARHQENNAPTTATMLQPSIPEQIAIIGMSGRFPQARSVDELWQILAEGRDAISEIPLERFDWREPYANGTINCKWLGAMPGVAEFDASFFEISPREAQTMDPRQRLLLQEGWRALEDAGYGELHLRHEIGMFVGVEQGEYQALVVAGGALTANHDAILAARLSYFLNLRGPAMAINTSCSSGLVAAHQACLSLRAGECDAAIAAGVNVSLTAPVYAGMSHAGMLSEDGRCRAFDERANGMVPAEAVVAVVLKRLARAQADGDPIRAVILGSGINYDGRTNGITAPNGAAQAQLIEKVYRRAGVRPRDIDYVVAHGTATRLGDPVEINALQEVFGGRIDQTAHCALTSTKSNLGHSFAASGLVSLVSAVKALEHELIPASLHCEHLSDYIQWQHSSLYVNCTPRPWPRTAARKRIAGVSAFGMSGTNAHMVLQEYEAPAEAGEAGVTPYWILALSAKSALSLQQRLHDLREALQAREWDAPSVQSLSYTLLCGRQHFAHRCMIVAQDREDAIHLLERAAAGDRPAKVFSGVAPREFSGQKALLQYGQDLLDQLSSGSNGGEVQESLYALADLYCQGYALPWQTLFGETAPRRIALPTYPFAKERYWVDESASSVRSRAAPGLPPSLHPLLQENTSDVDCQRFSSIFTGQEFYLNDHVVNGDRVLPGVAYLEMARAAVALGGGAAPAPGMTLSLRHIVWSQPLIVRDQPVRLHIDLYRRGRDEIGYEIYSETAKDAGHERIVHSQGAGVWRPEKSAPRLDIQDLEARSDLQVSMEECYQRLRTSGLEYGAAYRALEKASVGVDESGARYVVARLKLPSTVSNDEAQFLLHPAMLDGALHAAVGLWRAGPGEGKPLVPYGLEQIEIYGTLGETACAVLRVAAASSDHLPMLHVQLCNADGQVCVVMDGLSARPAEREPAAEPQRTIYFGRDWQDQPAGGAGGLDRGCLQRRVVLCPPGDGDSYIYEKVEAGLSGLDGVRCDRLEAPAGGIAQRYENYGWRLIECLQQILNDGAERPVLVQVVGERTSQGELLSGLGALLQTARLENPRLRGQVICLERGQTPDEWLERLQQDAGCADAIIRYCGGVRQVERSVELNAAAAVLPWKARGVYLISGGMGGLGRIVAAEILRQRPSARVVLVGRSELSEERRQQLLTWSAAGLEVEYRQADLSRREAVAELIEDIQRRHGRLDGVIHSAGVLRDGFLLKKTQEDYAAVMSSKVRVAVNLDEAIGTRPLDFFVSFSSTSGVYGNVGQCDYAAANAYLDAYAQYRQERVERGECHGHSLSVAWPLWAEGGMQMPPSVGRQLREQGLVPLTTDEGIAALYAAFGAGRARIHLHRVSVPRQSVQQPVADVASNLSVETTLAAIPAAGERSFAERVLSYLTHALSSTLKLPPERIEADAPFERYGLDSILALELTNALEKIFGSLSKTLFFEYQSLAALARYFAQAHRDRLLQILEAGRQASSSAPTIAAVATPVAAGRTVRTHPGFQTQATPPRETADLRDIAIIGVGGRYPQANTLEEFWDNLKSGKDCIGEIPQQRWNHARYFDAQQGELGKTYGKWGGFIDDVAEFDPLFFNISPVEARVMDPQERLFLQCAYETLEDAGYTRETLRKQTRLGREGNVGVFVGVMYEEYQLYGAQAQALGKGFALSGSPSSIANRVSYFCDFHGPSLAVDTMCSSSLTAIHLACESLLRRQCETALAGGVNVTVHPNKYLMLAQGRFLSSDGRCSSFGEGGDGYVPGEGVGAVLLKPLSNALADEDRIYAVIRGSVVNHGGKTNGYSVPNPNAQANLIAQALQSSGIEARTISYVEAHGTGTALGDPIEIAGLVKAFQQQTSATAFCAIGSVKSNIGHCESAAGIAALTKVLLQMRHGQLVPSLHSHKLNPYIDFANSPFVVQRELGEWRRPTIQVNGVSREYPRLAGISSFGAGGSNAHVVVEEHRPSVSHLRAPAQSPCMIVLSAKVAEALQRRVQQLLDFVESAADVDVADIAYTLQVGREPMEFRLAFVVDSMAQLRSKLLACAAGEQDIQGCYRGEAKRNREMLAAFAADDDLQRAIASWMARGKHDKLLEFWVKGLQIDWNQLYSANENRPRRIALPTYPFARERYWIGEHEIGLDERTSVVPEAVRAAERVLSKQWEATPALAQTVSVQRVVIIANDATQTLAQSLSLQWPQSRIVRTQESSWREGADWSECDGLIDIVGCGDEEDPSLAWIEAVQHWIQARAALGGRVLCVTRGLEREQNDRINGSGALRAGLYRMLQSEYGRIRSRHVDVEHCEGSQWIEQCVRELSESEEVEVCYRGGQRYRAQLCELALSAEGTPLHWPPAGVLWVSGGTRGLGYACAQHFVRHHGVKRLVLTGREVLPAPAQWPQYETQSSGVGEKIRAIRALQSQGVDVHVSSVDLCDEAALLQEMQQVGQTLGPIAGVLHCAGLADGHTPAFIRKSRETMEAVLAPKVSGLQALLSCLRSQPPVQFCVLFSSISGAVPDLATGQSDYAMANGYMDYAAQSGEVDGVPVVSVQWGSWKESGMGEVRSRVYRELGLLSHSDAQGLQWLDRIVSAQLRGVVAPLWVDESRFDARRLLQRRAPVAPAMRAASAAAGIDVSAAPAGELLARVQQWLCELFAQQLQMEQSKIELDTPLPDYGVDSVLLMQVLAPINAQVGEPLDPSMLYEHQTIEAFSKWLVSKYGAVLATSLPGAAASAPDVAGSNPPNRASDTSVTPPAPTAPTSAAHRIAATAEQSIQPLAATSSAAEPLAVVGLSCRFAGADDLQAYWELLAQGRSAIAPIPPSRWGEASEDWAGLLENVSHFDPQYFHLSLADARAMDRQALMVLEESLKAWHHAGYEAAELKGARAGVYLGARGQYHADAQSLLQAPNPILATGQNYLSANISQFFDLRGPSLVVDTACSSALVALNMAAQGLRSGEITAALVGGVSLLSGPGALRMFERRGILQRGEYHIFDRRAQGAILGEGVGLVVLKTQAQALADGDRIYALIRAVAVNNDGRTAGPTAPNVHAQKDVMQQALSRSGWRAQDISHIDVNGSGSEVTDLLELRAIEAVYRAGSVQPCDLGSMKPNIGHPLCAEGIASLIKVVMMLHHGQRVPFLSAREPMLHYDLQASPFRFTRQLRPWGDEARVAAINSFADGGTNAHVILEACASNDAARRQPLQPPLLNKIDVSVTRGASPAQSQQHAPTRSGQPAMTDAETVVTEGAWE